MRQRHPEQLKCLNSFKLDSDHWPDCTHYRCRSDRSERGLAAQKELRGRSPSRRSGAVLRQCRAASLPSEIDESPTLCRWLFPDFPERRRQCSPQTTCCLRAQVRNQARSGTSEFLNGQFDPHVLAPVAIVEDCDGPRQLSSLGVIPRMVVTPVVGKLLHTDSQPIMLAADNEAVAAVAAR